jgi:hypothetical protein
MLATTIELAVSRDILVEFFILETVKKHDQQDASADYDEFDSCFNIYEYIE